MDAYSIRKIHFFIPLKGSSYIAALCLIVYHGRSTLVILPWFYPFSFVSYPGNFIQAEISMCVAFCCHSAVLCSWFVLAEQAWVFMAQRNILRCYIIQAEQGVCIRHVSQYIYVYKNTNIVNLSQASFTFNFCLQVTLCFHVPFLWFHWGSLHSPGLSAAGCSWSGLQC